MLSREFFAIVSSTFRFNLREFRPDLDSSSDLILSSDSFCKSKATERQRQESLYSDHRCISISRCVPTNYNIWNSKMTYWGLICTQWWISRQPWSQWAKTRSPKWFVVHYITTEHLQILTEIREPALALATVSFSFSDTCLCTAWKLFKAAEKSFIKRSFWSLCWR